MPLKDLRGREFGMLKVRHYVGIRGAKAYWCCACACLPTCKDCAGGGCTVKVRSTKLLTGHQVSCGCSRTDPDKRRAAAMKVPIKVRHARAVSGGKCHVNSPPNFNVPLTRAADLAGVTTERIMELSRMGILRTIYRKSARTVVSASDLAAYIDAQQREPKACPRADATGS